MGLNTNPTRVEHTRSSVSHTDPGLTPPGCLLHDFRASPDEIKNYTARPASADVRGSGEREESERAQTPEQGMGTIFPPPARRSEPAAPELTEENSSRTI